jgi:uncharacterized protein (TIGR00369 family)
MAEVKDHAAMIASLSDGWIKAMGVRFLRATEDEVVAELDVSATHLQPMGIVHGGVYAGLVETVASVGAGISTMQRGRLPVGLENHTTFLRAARSGTLRATATPLTRGSRTQVWRAEVTDADGRVLATGQVRFLVLEEGSPLAGESVGVKGP